jgi:hypothetical protein
MNTEVFSHRVRVEHVDFGSSFARLDPPAEPAAAIAPEAVLALAHRSCDAAIEGLVNESESALHYAPTSSALTHLRAAIGTASAAALVDRELPHHVADDIRRNGNAHARVNVAVVDGDGDAVALGTFEFFITR